MLLLLSLHTHVFDIDAFTWTDIDFWQVGFCGIYLNFTVIILNGVFKYYTSNNTAAYLGAIC